MWEEGAMGMDASGGITRKPCGCPWARMPGRTRPRDGGFGPLSIILEVRTPSHLGHGAILRCDGVELQGRRGLGPGRGQRRRRRRPPAEEDGCGDRGEGSLHCASGRGGGNADRLRQRRRCGDLRATEPPAARTAPAHLQHHFSSMRSRLLILHATVFTYHV